MLRLDVNVRDGSITGSVSRIKQLIDNTLATHLQQLHKMSHVLNTNDVFVLQLD